jgi:hypothetical protein
MFEASASTSANPAGMTALHNKPPLPNKGNALQDNVPEEGRDETAAIPVPAEDGTWVFTWRA